MCWCGANSLQPYGPHYLRCKVCGTLVGQAGLADDEALVRNDEADFYGKRYWLEHQRDELSLPDIYARARQDLPERCVHWLKSLIRYRQPPARILEIGAGHGAFTALLRFAGYDATALDLSPWVAEFARTRFGIDYLVGPVEDQELESHSVDVVIANDVLEHLAYPVATMRRCAELLKPDGLLVIQTPEAPDERSYDDLVADRGLFLEHIERAATEHLYLFGRKALGLLLARVGLVEVVFEEPVYPYDMWCVAGSAPVRRSEADFGELVGPDPSGLLTLALIDSHTALRASERDRADRLKVIETLDAALGASGGGPRARPASTRLLAAARDALPRALRRRRR